MLMTTGHLNSRLLMLLNKDSFNEKYIELIFLKFSTIQFATFMECYGASLLNRGHV
jgi:hypothetical protein